MKTERSTTVRSRICPGSSWFSSRTARSMPSATSTVLAPDCLTMSRARPGRPSISEALRRSSMPSTTRATSGRKMGRPFRTATIRFRNPSTERNLPATRTSGSRSLCSSLPAGRSMFSRSSAPATCA